jgi:hypothetical protein
MSLLSSKPSHDKDALLANFTDQVLNGDEFPQDFSIPLNDMELKELAETVLLINNSYDDIDVDEEKAERMYAKIVAAWKKQPEKDTAPDGLLAVLNKIFKSQERWRPQRSRQHLGFALAVVSMTILVLLATPFISSIVTATPGSAGLHPASTISILLAIILAAAVILWAGRKR